MENLQEEIRKTKGEIFCLEQEIFYAKEKLEMLKFNLHNMKYIVERQNNSQ